MKISVEIPKWFEEDYKRDGFKESFERIINDLICISGGYTCTEKRDALLIEMLMETFSKRNDIKECLVRITHEKESNITKAEVRTFEGECKELSQGFAEHQVPEIALARAIGNHAILSKIIELKDYRDVDDILSRMKKALNIPIKVWETNKYEV